MSSLKSRPSQVANRIREALSKKQYRGFFSKLRLVSLPVHHFVFEQNHRIGFIYLHDNDLSTLDRGKAGEIDLSLFQHRKWSYDVHPPCYIFKSLRAPYQILAILRPSSSAIVNT